MLVGKAAHDSDGDWVIIITCFVAILIVGQKYKKNILMYYTDYFSGFGHDYTIAGDITSSTASSTHLNIFWTCFLL